MAGAGVMAASKRYWVWIDGMVGEPPHKLHERLEASGIAGAVLGHSFHSWSTTLAYLRECMKAGFICRVYEEQD